MGLAADTLNRLGVALGLFAAGTEVGAAIDASTTALAGRAQSQNAYIVSDVGVKDLLAAAAVARTVVVTLRVTTAFANGDGAQPTVTIGEEGNATKFAAAAVFTTAALGRVFVFTGTLTANKKLQATQVAGTGTTETGAYTIDAVAF
jgi:hypothetical protein